MIDPRNIVAILLAAGRSSRFGEDDKLLAKIGGHPLILHAAQRIVELDPRRKIAVCSADVGQLLSPLGFEIILNPDARSGLSTSLARGIEAAGQSPAALIFLGDMPFVTLAHLRSLLAQFDEPSTPIVASSNGAKAMPPAIFARSHFNALRNGQGDQGARELLKSAHHIFAPPEELADIDTIEDLRRIRP